MLGLDSKCAESRETKYKLKGGEFIDMGAPCQDTVFDSLARILEDSANIGNFLET